MNRVGGKGQGQMRTAEVRFDHFFESLESAVQETNLSLLGGRAIRVVADQMSQDGTKIIVSGVPPGVQWQQLKDHFKSVGEVAFANFNQQAGPAGALGGAMPRAGFGPGGLGNQTFPVMNMFGGQGQVRTAE